MPRADSFVQGQSLGGEALRPAGAAHGPSRAGGADWDLGDAMQAQRLGHSCDC